jgi:putative Ig domain-containing protein
MQFVVARLRRLGFFVLMVLFAACGDSGGDTPSSVNSPQGSTSGGNLAANTPLADATPASRRPPPAAPPGNAASSNTVPTISGAPPTQVLNESQYSFAPSASDPDGDALTFSIVNKPAWATFETATGRLHGRPGRGDLGTTNGIVIRVSDGDTVVALQSFNVTVQAVATASVTLSWVPPTDKTDGSQLSDLAGFKLYWGTKKGELSNSATVTNSGLVAYVVENLVPGTYFFMVTAFDRSGVEGEPSNVVTKTVS